MDSSFRAAIVVVSFLVVAVSGCIESGTEPDWRDSEDADFGFADPAGDTKWGGGTNDYEGAGAYAMDVVAVRLHDGPEYLEFHLEIRDLEAHQEHKNEPDFHAQYAVSFMVNAESPGYSTRASFSGTDRARNDEGAWQFSLHDQRADEWPSATGGIDTSTIKWRIPLAMLGARPGDQFTDWSVSTWASMDNKDQYGDRASTSRSFEVGSAGG